MKLLNLHYRSFTSSIAKIISKPFDHLLNILTIAVIITALCSVLTITKGISIWEKTNITFPQIVIYLKSNATQNDVSTIENTLNKYNQKFIKSYQFISKSEGLEQLKQDEQLKQIASDIIIDNTNPLPDVLIINTNTANTKHLTELNKKIRSFSMVDEVQMDSNYANKVNDLANFIKEISIFLQIAFTVILVIVIYNMIRLQMLLRQDEIIVSRLIGASDSFIMRPLAYYAILQVTISLTIAFFLVNWFIHFLNSLFLSLNNLFGHSFILANLTGIQFVQLFVILIIFTVFGVFLAVQWVFKNSYAK